jgi:signal transduction histidine kinase
MNLGLIPSLFLFFGVLSLIYAAALHQYHNAKYQKVIHHWSLGSFLLGIATLLTIFRVEIPLLVSYFLANALAFMGYVEFTRALRRLARNDHTSSVNRWSDLLILGGYMVLLLALDTWTPADYREVAKTSFVSLVVTVVFILNARDCFALGRKDGLPLARIFGHLFVVVAVLWSIRTVVAVARIASSAFDPSPINTTIFVLLFITGVLRYLIFPLVLLQKIENDKQAQLKDSLVKASKTATAGALSASIAHELSQPLTAMRISGELLRKAMTSHQARLALVNPADVLPIVDRVLEQNERAASIITTLRSIFSQSLVAKTEVDLSRVIQKTAALIREEAARYQIGVELSLDNAVRVDIAEDEFQQMLLNLLLNSVQALQNSPDGNDRTIVITTRSVGGMVELAVTDNGPGVRPDMVATLFEILSTSKESGMGIGLWLSKYIVERHGGSIVYSPAQQGGACFTITLPLQEVPRKTV